MAADGLLEVVIPLAICQIARDFINRVILEVFRVVLHAFVAWQDQPFPEFERVFKLIIRHGFKILGAGNYRVQEAPGGWTPY